MESHTLSMFKVEELKRARFLERSFQVPQHSIDFSNDDPLGKRLRDLRCDLHWRRLPARSCALCAIGHCDRDFLARLICGTSDLSILGYCDERKLSLLATHSSYSALYLSKSSMRDWKKPGGGLNCRSRPKLVREHRSHGSETHF